MTHALRQSAGASGGSRSAVQRILFSFLEIRCAARLSIEMSARPIPRQDRARLPPNDIGRFTGPGTVGTELTITGTFKETKPEFRFGEGKISGVLSVYLGWLALGARRAYRLRQRLPVGHVPHTDTAEDE